MAHHLHSTVNSEQAYVSSFATVLSVLLCGVSSLLFNFVSVPGVVEICRDFGKPQFTKHDEQVRPTLPACQAVVLGFVKIA